MSIAVQVRLFARLRELCGRGEIHLELPAGADASACFEHLTRECPGVAGQRDRLGVAVNEEYVAWDHALEDGDVVTFIPPVSGGRRPVARWIGAAEPTPTRTDPWESGTTT